MTKSPLFLLSRGSKELFHSNMLYWISQVYPSQFKQILSSLIGRELCWEQLSIKVYREKQHFDLCVVSTNEKSEEEYLLVIENKVKSIPTLEQLQQYKAKFTRNELKGQPIFLLLSLVTDFPNIEEIKTGWEIANYQQLAHAIYSILSTITFTYHRDILIDYCSYIVDIHQMQMQWTFKAADTYIEKMVNIEVNQEFKMNDVIKKILYSRLAINVKDALSKDTSKKVVLGDNKRIVDDYKNDEARKTNEFGPGTIYVNSGMTRSTGILDVKIRIRGNLLQVIQVQGAKYKHCVETLSCNSLNGDVIEILKTYITAKKSILSGNKDIKEYPAEISKDFLVEAQNPIPVPFHEEQLGGSKMKNDYNKYNDTFIYQYVTINEKVTIAQLVEAITKEVKEIVSKITKQQK